MNGYSIPVGISEDWDRTADSDGITMNSTSGYGLGATGAKVKANTDLVHAHVMPYYHPTEVVYAAQSWPYIDHYLSWLNDYVGKPTFITEVSHLVGSHREGMFRHGALTRRLVAQTMWSSAVTTDHLRGGDSIAETQATLSNFRVYWNLYSDNCATFKLVSPSSGLMPGEEGWDSRTSPGRPGHPTRCDPAGEADCTQHLHPSSVTF